MYGKNHHNIVNYPPIKINNFFKKRTDTQETCAHCPSVVHLLRTWVGVFWEDTESSTVCVAQVTIFNIL